MSDHVLDCHVDAASPPVTCQCSGCALAKARKKPLKSKSKFNHVVSINHSSVDTYASIFNFIPAVQDTQPTTVPLMFMKGN